MTARSPVTRSHAASRGTGGTGARRPILVAVLLLALPLTPSPAAPASETALTRLLERHAVLLTRHRPDLAERDDTLVPRVPFVPLDAASLPAHANTLRQMLAEADALPASPARDTLRARLAAEIADASPGGALSTDPLLWLDLVAAAARVPFLAGRLSVCTRTHHAAQQLRRLPEALRGAAVLTRAHPPDPEALEARLSAVEAVLRQDLPERTGPCIDSRRRAAFVEADTLAAASLASFRRWVRSGP